MFLNVFFTMVENIKHTYHRSFDLKLFSCICELRYYLYLYEIVIKYKLLWKETNVLWMNNVENKPEGKKVGLSIIFWFWPLCGHFGILVFLAFWHLEIKIRHLYGPKLPCKLCSFMMPTFVLFCSHVFVNCVIIYIFMELTLSINYFRKKQMCFEWIM